MQREPGNVEGWRMLGWSYLQTGRAAEAANAYGKAAALDPESAEYRSAQGEATVLAADGQVTPAAQAIFRRRFSVDSADPRARYYLAVAKDQAGDQKGAMDDWIALMKSAPPGAPWAGEVRAFVERVAAERKIDLAGRLPPAPAPQMAEAPSPRRAVPNAEQMAAAQNMNAGDRQAMIEGMVAGLAERLKAEPEGPRRLGAPAARPHGAGPVQQAAADYRAARQALAGSPDDQRALREAALQLGVSVG